MLYVDSSKNSTQPVHKQYPISNQNTSKTTLLSKPIPYQKQNTFTVECSTYMYKDTNVRISLVK